MLPGRFLSVAVARLDLRRRLRAPGSSRILTFYLSGMGIIVAAFLLRQIDPPADQSAHPGTQLLQVLALYQLCLLLVIACLSTSTSITEERSSGTWDLLLLSRLSSLGLVYNKLLAALAFNLLLLLASLPLYTVVSLLYGVALSAVARVCLVFLATMVLFASAGVAISVVSKRSTTAKSVALAAAVAYGGLSFIAVIRGTPPLTGAFALSMRLNPFAALLSALPHGNLGGLAPLSAVLDGGLGTTPKAPLCEQYFAVAAFVSVLLLLATAPLLRTLRIRGVEGTELERRS
jgi:ABC-2 type transport system permease protein